MLYGTTLNSCTNDILKLLQQKSYIEFEINDTVLGLISVSFIIGLAIGSFLSGFLDKKYGTRPLLIVATILATIFTALQFIPVNCYYTFVIRILVGMFQSVQNTLVPVYTKLRIPDKYKSIFGTSYQVFINVGILLESCTLLIINGKADNYWVSFMLELIFNIVLLICLLLIKDDKNKTEENTQQNNDQVKVTSKEILNAVLLGFSSQWTGINAIIVYSTELLQKLFKSDQASIYSSILITGLNLLSGIISLFIVPRLTSKLSLLYFVTMCICVVSLIIYALCDTVIDSDELIYVFTVLYLLGFQCGPGPMPYIICQEMFQPQNRIKMTSLTFTTMWVVNIIIVFAFSYFTKILYVAYIIFAIGCFVPSLVMMFTYPKKQMQVSYKEMVAINVDV